jgi:hypothetical protein
MPIRAPKTHPPEVRCSTCRVSFPPEVRRCLHCGGRTHAPGDGPTVHQGDGDGRLRELEPFIVGEPPPAARRDSAPTASKRGAPDDDEEMEVRSPLRVASALIWILVALAGGLYRACSG